MTEWTEQAIADHLAGKCVHVDKITGQLTEISVDDDYIPPYDKYIPPYDKKVTYRTDATRIANKRTWLVHEVDDLVRSRRSGEPFASIATRLGRTLHGVSNKHLQLIERGKA